MRGNPVYLVIGFSGGSIMTIFNLIGFIWGVGDGGYFLLAGIIILMGICLYGVSWVFDETKKDLNVSGDEQ